MFLVLFSLKSNYQLFFCGVADVTGIFELCKTLWWPGCLMQTSSLKFASDIIEVIVTIDIC